jgi:phage/plasmid-like protein (TIGR03299 family)
MPHDLDMNVATGQRAMFSVGLTPWHREGVVLTDAPSFDEGIRLSGVGYDVAVKKLFIDGGAEAEMSKAVVRTDTGAVLATVGNGYSPLQNRDAFGVLEPLLDSGVAQLETGGVLKGGAKVWMLVRFRVDDPVVQEVFTDEVVPFGMVTNNHDGNQRAIVMYTPIRVVCANTLGMAVRGMTEGKDAISVVHRGAARVRMVDAATTLFNTITDRYKSIALQYRTLKETRLTVDQFERSLLNRIAPLPPLPEGDEVASRGYERTRANAIEKRDALTQLWTGGLGHTGDMSAWEAYNGVVEAMDHNDDLFTVKGSRVEALAGRMAKRKSELLGSLLDTCALVGAR